MWWMAAMGWAWARPYGELAGGLTAGVLPELGPTLQLGAGAERWTSRRTASLGLELRLLPPRQVSLYHGRGQVDAALLGCATFAEKLMLDVCGRVAAGAMWAHTQGTTWEPWRQGSG
jgi:hypothetical protein